MFGPRDGELARLILRSKVFLCAGEPIVVLDLDQRIMDANDEAVRFFGWGREELVGKELDALVPEDERHHVAELLALCRRGEHQREVPSRRLTKDGQAIPVLLSHCLLKDEAGVPIGIAIMSKDATRLRRTEDALSRTETRMVAVVNAAKEAIIEVSREGLILSVNPSCERMFGHRTQEIVGRSVDEILSLSPWGDSAGEALATLAATRVRTDIVAIGKAGRAFPAELSVAEIEGYGAFSCFVHDSTERREAEKQKAVVEAQLFQAQKMEALGILASGLAHDFNNLLMGMSGCASIALAALPHGTPAGAYLEEIKKSAETGAAITRQLLSISRSPSGPRQTFALDDAVAKQELMLRRLLRKDIELTLSLAARDGWISASTAEIQLILLNLAINARDAMPEGGRLTIETREVELEPECATLPPGRYVALRVADTGAGMPESTRRRVFEPFFTTKKGGRGTGLGLYMVYGLVKKAGGAVSVASREGEGTAFEILWPRVEAALPEPVVSKPAPQGKERILLVEDDRLVRLGVAHFLESGGYRVAEASDAPEAIQRLEKSPHDFDLVITDLVMPSGSGLSVARAAQEAGLPVITISAYPGSAETLGSEVPSLQKPFGQDLVLATVHDVLAAKAARQRVLLVDDERIVRFPLADELALHGFEVLEAADGNQAWEVAQRFPGAIAALVLDLELPGMPSAALARAVLAQNPRCRVIYMSGYPREIAEERGLLPPGSHFLQKPIDLDEVARFVRGAVEAEPSG